MFSKQTFVDAYTLIHVDISYFNRDTKQSNVTGQNAKKHEVINSLNKCSTENVLNWCPSCFVTAAVLLDVFSTAKSGTALEDHLEYCCLGSMCAAWCTVLHEHKVTRLEPLRKQ